MTPDKRIKKIEYLRDYYHSLSFEEKLVRKAQARARSKALSPEQKQERNEKSRKYRAAVSPEQREKRLTAHREWLRNRSPEKRKADNEKHRELIRGLTEEKRQEYSKVQHRCAKRWHQENPDKSLSSVHRRRARLVGADGSHTTAEWKDLKRRHGYRCLMCRKAEPEIRLTRDHIVPLIQHGSNSIDNIQPLCRRCNSIKGRKTIDLREAV